MIEINAAYADLETDRVKHGGIGQGFIEDHIASLWRAHDRASEAHWMRQPIPVIPKYTGLDFDWSPAQVARAS